MIITILHLFMQKGIYEIHNLADHENIYLCNANINDLPNRLQKLWTKEKDK